MQLDNEEKKAIIWALDPDNGHTDFWAVTRLRDIFSDILAKPLFTTNDGVDIYEGYSFYFIEKGEIYSDEHYIGEDRPEKSFKYRESAEEYLDNINSYSLNDIYKKLGCYLNTPLTRNEIKNIISS